ncbi:hypothetical protein LTR29_018044, partial [Friedmanniomyces endolithicus]
MVNLAATYHKEVRCKEAEELEVKVIKASSRLLGKEQPDTLTATANLTSTYRKQVWWMEAEELEVKVVGVMLRVL